MRYVLGAIDKARDGYVAVVRRLVRVAVVGVVVVAGVLAVSAVFSVTPQSFLPDEDQGAIFAALRLPEGASLSRTEAVVKQVEDIVKPIPGVEGVLSVVGLNFIDYVASSNQAFFVIRLKPYEDAPMRRRARMRSSLDFGPSWRRSRAPSRSHSTFRPSSASAALAGFSTCWKRSRVRRLMTSPQCSAGYW